MKNFSDLRNQILNEDSEGNANCVGNAYPGVMGDGQAADAPDVASFDVAHPLAIKRLNAYIGAAASKAVIDPISVLRTIQRKLAVVGLQFIIPPSLLIAVASKNNSTSTVGGPNVVPQDGTEHSFPLTYLGGRYGVMDNNYNIGTDDNISRRVGHGLTLNVKYYVNSGNNMITVKAQIVPSPMQGNEPSTMGRPFTQQYTPSIKEEVISNIKEQIEHVRETVKRYEGKFNPLTAKRAWDTARRYARKVTNDANEVNNRAKMAVQKNRRIRDKLNKGSMTTKSDRNAYLNLRKKDSTNNLKYELDFRTKDNSFGRNIGIAHGISKILKGRRPT